MSAHSHNYAAVAPAEMLDPVCGMTISPDDAVVHVDHKGRTYYFCSQSCLDQFRANGRILLLQGLQDEVRREARPIRQVAPALAAFTAHAVVNAAQGVMSTPGLR